MALPANIVDLDPVDFCGKQVMSFKEALWTQAFEDPQLSELLTIIPGVKAKQQVVILGFLGLLGKKASTTQCAPDPSTQEIPSVQKFYDPANIEDRFTECWKNLLEKFSVWGLGNGLKKADLTGTDFANFLEERVLESLRQAVYRLVWFGDTAADNVADGGHLTAGIDPLYFTAIDGFWKQFFAIATASPSQRVIITQNSGGLGAPELPTLETATTGGTLAAATYYVKVAAVNANGVSIASAEASQVTTGATSTVTVTYAPVVGATGYRVYIGTSPGAQTVYFADTASPLLITTLVGALSGSPQTSGTASTYAGQAFTPTDTTNQVVTGYLQSMITNMDERMAGMSPKFFVTRSIAEQYRAERRAFANIDLAYTRTEEGWDMLEFAGYPMIVLNFEDRMIKEYFNDGLSYYLPHRIYFTPITNLHLATGEEGELSTLKAWFRDYDMQYYIDILFSVDALVIEDYKLMVGY